MIVVIPVSAPQPAWVQESEMDGGLYRLAFTWNERESAWYLDLSDIDGGMIRAGIKLVPNWPLLRKVRHASRPPGELVVLDDVGAGITLENLGTDSVLIYVESATLAEALSG